MPDPETIESLQAKNEEYRHQLRRAEAKIRELERALPEVLLDSDSGAPDALAWDRFAASALCGYITRGDRRDIHAQAENDATRMLERRRKLFGVRP